MHALWQTVLGLTALLAFAVLMVPASRRLAFPYTVLLAAAGLILGILQNNMDAMGITGPVNDVLSAFDNLQISSEMVFFVFLPALVFEAALGIKTRRLLDDLPVIMFLAIGGLLISTFFCGWVLNAASGIPLMTCLLIGTIISATDPVAVVALFKELGAPKRLAVLVEGESLFNDATAIVLFTILSAMLTGQADAGVLAGALSFLKVFFGGILVGWLCGVFVCWILKKLFKFPLVETSLSISLAYLSFIIAEHYLHVSGVMAVVSAALVMASRGRSIISTKDWTTLNETWHEIGFWANSIIFMLVGMIVPDIMTGLTSNDWLYILVLGAAALTARAVILFGFMPMIRRSRKDRKISTGYKAVMLWGGLRGAVSLALALAVIENSGFSEQTRKYTGILVTGFVLLTLFLNAPTMKFVISFFKLDQLSPANQALKDRAFIHSMSSITESINDISKSQEISRDVSEKIADQYCQREEKHKKELARLGELDHETWVRVGLKIATMSEENFYTELFNRGFLSAESCRILLNYAETLDDSLKISQGQYINTADEVTAFSGRFKTCVKLQRSCGWDKPLAHLVARRFEVLMTIRNALKDFEGEGIEKVRSMIPEEDAKLVQNLIQQRYEKVDTAFSALKKQYPEYAAILEKSYLERGALQVEKEQYSQMHESSAVNREVFTELMKSVERREKKLKVPMLDLGLSAELLIKKVPLFNSLEDSAVKKIASVLKPRLTLPGEKIITEGDKAESMYFISSGAVEVVLNKEKFILATGDFFGEIALITEKPRNADVISSGFCDLLVLETAEFKKLVEAHAGMKEVIEKTAQERLTQDES